MHMKMKNLFVTIFLGSLAYANADTCYCQQGIPLENCAAGAPIEYEASREGFRYTGLTKSQCETLSTTGVDVPGKGLITGFGNALGGNYPRGCYVTWYGFRWNEDERSHNTCDLPDPYYCLKRVSHCQPIHGCIDPKANNYNVSASIDDGSCTYHCPCAQGIPLNQQNCESPHLAYTANSGTYDSTITQEQCEALAYGGTLVTHYGRTVDTAHGERAVQYVNSNNNLKGCFFFNGIRWNSAGDGLTDCDTGNFWNLCIKMSPSQCQPIHGCIDPEANNYNVNASIDDNSCRYTAVCDGVPTTNLTSAPPFQGLLATREGTYDSTITQTQCEGFVGKRIKLTHTTNEVFTLTEFSTVGNNNIPQGCTIDQMKRVRWNTRAEGTAAANCDSWNSNWGSWGCIKIPPASSCGAPAACADSAANNYDAETWNHQQETCTYDSYCAHGLKWTNMTTPPTHTSPYSTRDGDYDPSMTRDKCEALAGTEFEHHTEGTQTFGSFTTYTSTTRPRGCYVQLSNYDLRFNFDRGALVGGSCDVRSDAACIKPPPSQCQPIEGCVDPNALNEDVTASIDDGSCQYDCFCPVGSGTGSLACTEEYEATKSEAGDHLDQAECQALAGKQLPCPAGSEEGCNGTFIDNSVQLIDHTLSPRGCWVQFMYRVSDGKKEASILFNSDTTMAGMKDDSESYVDGSLYGKYLYYWIKKLSHASCKCAIGERGNGTDCVACGSNSYTDTQQLLTDGDQACTPHSACPEGQLTVTAGTTTTDTVCGAAVSATDCTALKSSYQSQSCCARL